MVVEIVILGATLVMISLRRFFHIPIERPAAALAGGLLMIAFGFVAPAEVVAAVDWATILLLVGMMLVVASLEGTGVFSWAARALVTHARTPTRLMGGVVVATAALCALVLNDAVVLFFTPVLVGACRSLGRDPVPYLVGEALAANVGSVATPIGNPQNAFIATRAGIEFGSFTAHLAPPAILALGATFLLLRGIFRAELSRPFDEPPHVAPPQHPTSRTVVFGLAGLGVVAVALVASGPLAVPLHVVALGLGAGFLFVGPLVGAQTGKRTLRNVDWSVILLFVGLFIVLAGVRDSDAFAATTSALPRAYDDAGSIVLLAAVTAVLSNLVSNVPAVLLLAEGLPPEPTGWYVLAASSTLAGNATLVGAAANLLVAQRAEEDGVLLRAWQFMRVGLPVAAVTLAIVVAWLVAIPS